MIHIFTDTLNRFEVRYTVAMNELSCLKNAGPKSLFFISYEKSAPMAIEKIKILGAILELPDE